MRVVILPGAEQDMRDIKRYTRKKFGDETWSETYSKFKRTINHLKDYPQSGSIPEELEDFNPLGYREAVSGMNRIIYSVENGVLYLHVVTDVRRDMKALLAKRFLRR
jgi:toxin ParE1/3/4